MFGPKRDELTVDVRNLHIEELHNLYSSPNIIRQIKSIRLVGHVARMREERKVYKVLLERPDGKSPLGRPKSRCEDWIIMDLGEIAWGVWTGFSWLRIRDLGGLL
jgi:hypothetical protein